MSFHKGFLQLRDNFFHWKNLIFIDESKMMAWEWRVLYQRFWWNIPSDTSYQSESLKDFIKNGGAFISTVEVL